MPTVKQFMETDCQLLNPMHLFLGLHTATGGDPCTTGCTYFNGGKCPAYLALQPETVRGMARRLDISISEARRRRAKGA